MLLPSECWSRWFSGSVENGAQENDGTTKIARGENTGSEYDGRIGKIRKWHMKMPDVKMHHMKWRFFL